MPGAQITLIGLPIIYDLVARSPYVDKFEEFPGFPGIAEQFFDARRARLFFERMQAEQYDLAIQIHGSGVYSNPFALMLGARTTAGFIRRGDAPGLLQAALPWPQFEHASRRALALATFLGAESRGESIEVPIDDEDHHAAARFLAGSDGPLIGLQPGARDSWRMWSKSRFAAVGTQLRRTLGGTIVVLGGPDEVEAAMWIADTCGQPVRTLAGRTSLLEMAAVISRLSLLITNDSGPAHMAYALGTPSVTLFSTTRVEEWGPPTTAARHQTVTAPDGDMESIPVDDVAQAAHRALGQEVSRYAV